MKPSIAAKLAQLSGRLEELNRLLAAENVTADLDNYRKLTREHAEIAPVVELYQQYVQRRGRHPGGAGDERRPRDARVRRVRDQADPRAARGASKQELQKQLLPKDPNDERNIFLEIRAGTGGDESALFAGELFRMYSRYAERNRWQVEVISQSPSDLGGYKEIIAKIAGQGAYSRLKFESGGHRVQRVPVTETQGRIHTSACTVAVMPEADEIADVVLNPAELRIDTFRASGAGGQHVNKTDSAVRITHLPTGIVVECQDDRSQHKNRARALGVLAARIKDKQIREQQAKTAATRKSLIGSGDRSERIRTYNFPQGRVTDHRINLTLYKIDRIMDGELDELISALDRRAPGRAARPARRRNAAGVSRPRPRAAFPAGDFHCRPSLCAVLAAALFGAALVTTHSGLKHMDAAERAPGSAFRRRPCCSGCWRLSWTWSGWQARRHRNLRPRGAVLSGRRDTAHFRGKPAAGPDRDRAPSAARRRCSRCWARRCSWGRRSVLRELVATVRHRAGIRGAVETGSGADTRGAAAQRAVDAVVGGGCCARWPRCCPRPGSRSGPIRSRPRWSATPCRPRWCGPRRLRPRHERRRSIARGVAWFAVDRRAQRCRGAVVVPRAQHRSRCTSSRRSSPPIRCSR